MQRLAVKFVGTVAITKVQRLFNNLSWYFKHVFKDKIIFFCRKLNLSTNMIEKINGLGSLKRLRVLSLVRNYIKSFSGIVSIKQNHTLNKSQHINISYLRIFLQYANNTCMFYNIYRNLDNIS